MITERYGNVIEAARSGEINAIAHNVNCFCKQKLGFATTMAREFATNTFVLEDRENFEGDYNKLGQIDFKLITLPNRKNLWVINAYCQYHWSDPGPYDIPLDYDAFRLCMRKINREFKKSILGLPGLIGAGLDKGRPAIIKQIIGEELKNCDVIIYYPNEQS